MNAQPALADTTEVRSVCPYCGVGCGMVLEVRDRKIVKVRGDRDHPANAGRLCTKGSRAEQVLNHASRLDSAWQRVARDQSVARTPINAAMTRVASQLKQIVEQNGPDAVALYVSGQMSLEAQYLANKLAKGFLRTRHIESNSRLCMASAGSGYKQSLGADAPPGSYDDFDHADVFLVIGSNMADCHPILFLRLLDRVRQGARLIVVDPRRTATADKADLFLQIQPGTDLWLLNGLLHLLHANGWTDPEFMARYTEGWAVMPDFLADYPPDIVAKHTGLSEESLLQAASWLGTVKNWMSLWTMGLNQSTHGTWHTNALCNLHLATGSIGRQGCGPFSLTGQPNAMGGREMGYMGPGLPGQRSALDADDRAFVESVWQLPPGTIRAETSDGTLALFDAMAAGNIRACWIICTNPVASVADRSRVLAGLSAAELVVVQDAFADAETVAFADVVLPAALWAEAEGVMVNSERNVSLMQKAVDPPGEAMADWQIIAGIACAMGYEAGFGYASAAEVFEEIRQFWNPLTGYDLRGVDYTRLHQGPVQWPSPPRDLERRHPLRYLNDGISQNLYQGPDGELPALAFATPSRRARFLPRPALPPAECPDDEFPFVLNTGRLQHQWHTLTKTGRIAALNRLNPAPFVEIHPLDAERLGIVDAASVVLESRRGRAILPALLTDRVRPGQCFAPFHWNDAFGAQLAVNALTSPAVDPESLQPEFKYCAVSLTPAPVSADLPVKSDMAPIHLNEETVMTETVLISRALGLDKLPALELDEQEKLYVQGYLTGLGLRERKAGLPQLPEQAPMNPHRRLQLNGLLAGIFLDSAVCSLPEMTGDASDQPTMTLIWASQTGTAEMLAKNLSRQLASAGLRTECLPAEQVSLSNLASSDSAIFVVSSFGDGEAPDHARSLWRALQADSVDQMPNLNFAVLALGDSSYASFCGFGRQLERRLVKLGAKPLLERLDCDGDPVGQIDDWCEKLQTALRKRQAAKSIDEPVVWNRQHPFRAKLAANQLLNGSGSGKETRQIVLDIAGSGLTYRAGDAVGIWPQNPVSEVEFLLQRWQVEGTELVPDEADGAVTLRECLLHRIDISRIALPLLKQLASLAGDSELTALLQEDQRSALQDWLRGQWLADLVSRYPGLMRWQDWMAGCKRLQPRLYSIASAPALFPEEIHLTMSTVRWAGDPRGRGGICSMFLADLPIGGEVALFIQPTTTFLLPEDPARDVIMIGPGTGVAPFRAFLQQRLATAASGRNWLFFGEQNAATDFYYHDELSNMQQRGVLTRLDTAFSRDQSEKIYVQHRMLQAGAELWHWLEAGASIYVCGDASRMARDVDAALRRVVAVHGSKDEQGVNAYMDRLEADQRYLRDVY